MIGAHKADQLALYLDAVGRINLCFIVPVFGYQMHVRPNALKTFKSHFNAIDKRDNNVAIIRAVGSLDNNRVAVMDAGFDHRIAIDLQSIMFTASQHAGGHINAARFIADGLNRCSGGNAPIKGDGIHGCSRDQ